MFTHNLGYPRIGSRRELKKACESFWAGTLSKDELLWETRQLRRRHWQLQREAGIDLIPSNDFSLYDHVLDTALMVGAVPERYHILADGKAGRELEFYFAMARGVQRPGADIPAMEMTKWFDTNYHYIVPEFRKDQTFRRYSDTVIHAFEDALQMGITTKPVVLGPVSFLLLGKEREAGFDRIDLLDRLLPVYADILRELTARGAGWIQIDEPCLVLDLTEKQQEAYRKAYAWLRKEVPGAQLILATYFDSLGENRSLAAALPVDALHIDVVRGRKDWAEILTDDTFLSAGRILSLGVVNGRNIWKNQYADSLALIAQAEAVLGRDRLWIAPSCSLLHVPCDLDLETDEISLPAEIRDGMAFAKQKLTELVHLKEVAFGEPSASGKAILAENEAAVRRRQTSSLIHRPHVKERMKAIQEADFERISVFAERQALQQAWLQLPAFPTTTIGSFPQTPDIRQLRASFRKGTLSAEGYESGLEKEIAEAIRRQEAIGLDVLVHGEAERNDMVEYFGEQLSGYAFTRNGWVQSYGSRCVKPPVIYGDVERPEPMTVRWATYAQSLTDKPVKGMLTGPVTILQWSFVRDDQPRRDTAFQIALAIRDEVTDLEKAGIRVIQIDEPAIREGLPLRQADRAEYLRWSVDAFRLSTAGVADETQIHTHMCYSEFNDILEAIARMDADVITIETSRSQMELLDAFSEFAYPNEIGPGVYDIHSPRVPSEDEMVQLLRKALNHIPARNLWVNPDCGLKTRRWEETEAALRNMVGAAKRLRSVISQEVTGL